MENIFKQLKTKLYAAETIIELQDLIFDIAEEKITVAKQDDKELIYAETSYLYQLEKYANRKIADISNKRLGFLNLFVIEARKQLDKETFQSIKLIVREKLKNKNISFVMDSDE